MTNYSYSGSHGELLMHLVDGQWYYLDDKEEWKSLNNWLLDNEVDAIPIDPLFSQWLYDKEKEEYLDD